MISLILLKFCTFSQILQVVHILFLATVVMADFKTLLHEASERYESACQISVLNQRVES